jgi:hypothetical protein
MGARSAAPAPELLLFFSWLTIFEKRLGGCSAHRA